MTICSTTCYITTRQGSRTNANTAKSLHGANMLTVVAVFVGGPRPADTRTAPTSIRIPDRYPIDFPGRLRFHVSTASILLGVFQCSKDCDPLFFSNHASIVVLALKMLLQDCATIAADEVLSRWLRMQETALNMLTYMSLCDDAEASQSYDTLFNSVRDKVIEAAMV